MRRMIQDIRGWNDRHAVESELCGLAGAYHYHPELLILDEAASSLDQGSIAGSNKL